MDDYGLLQPSIGHSTAYTRDEFEKEMYRDDQALDQLYPFLNHRGALYIDATDYEENALLLNRDSNNIRSITVNPNYLKAFPVVDREGQPIQVSEKSEDWVLLVPEQYRDREEDIRHFYERENIRDFYLTTDQGQKLKIIWLAEGQRIFSSNPDVFPTEQNMIHDPIIHVKTEENHLFTYRSGILGGGLNDPLKLKLVDKDPRLTYKELQPEFDRHQIDDQIKQNSVFTFSQFLSQEVARLKASIRTSLLSMLGLASVFAYLIVQNLLILFHKHQKRFVVQRLFGIGFFMTYRRVFIWWLVTSFAFVVLSFAIDRILGLRWITGITDPHVLLVIFSLLSLETLATFLSLTVMERRNKVPVIKGGE